MQQRLDADELPGLVGRAGEVQRLERVAERGEAGLEVLLGQPRAVRAGVRALDELGVQGAELGERVGDGGYVVLGVGRAGEDELRDLVARDGRGLPVVAAGSEFLPRGGALDLDAFQ